MHAHVKLLLTIQKHQRSPQNVSLPQGWPHRVAQKVTGEFLTRRHCTSRLPDGCERQSPELLVTEGPPILSRGNELEASSNELNPKSLRNTEGRGTPRLERTSRSFTPPSPPRPHLRGPRRTGAGPARARPRRPARAPASRIWGSRALGAAPWRLGRSRRAQPRGQEPIAAAAPASGPRYAEEGLRHVPRPAGAAAAASVRGCRDAARATHRLLSHIRERAPARL